MDNLSKNLCNVVSQAVSDYNKALSEKYNIPINELQEVWNNNVGGELKKKPKSKEKSETKEEEKSSLCSYVFTKGDKEGKSCTSKVSTGSTTCKKHSEQKEKPTKSKKETTKKTEKSETSESSSTLKSKQKKLVIKRNKDGLFEHQPTGFVIDEKSKEVYGKYVNGSVIELTVEDLELCKKYDLNARIPKNLKNDKSNEDEEEEEECEDEDEEEEEEEDDE